VQVQLTRGVYNGVCIHRCNAETYTDDVVIKMWEDEGLISDLAETFDNLKKFKMKLNPEKCTFGVPQKVTRVYGLPSWY
jgi:hypothetical protein